MWSPTHTQPSPGSLGTTVNAPPIRGPLFLPSLISPDVASCLPEAYTMRPLQRSDYHSGFLDVLRVLTTVGDVSEKGWNEHYDWISRRDDTYYIVVVIDGEGRVVGCGTLVVERKL